MSKLTKAIKTGVVAGVCGVGLCALARRFKVTSRIAALAQNVEAVPFPGTRLYTFLAAKQLRPLYREIAREILEAGKFTRVLDLNTGPGYLPIELALQDASINVVGLDRSSDMVRVAAANGRAENVENRVEFALGDPANLPFPGRYFDLVVSVNVLHHWKNPLQVFEEVYHILVPGGEFWLYDYRNEVPVEEWQAFQKELPLYLRAPFEFGPVASWRAAYSREEMLDLASRTHFTDPLIEPRSLPLFGRGKPVFVRLKLHKQEQVRG